MKLLETLGATSRIWQIFIADSSSTTGAGLTGLVFNTSGLTAYYHRDTDTAATAITLATMTVGTFTSSGFKEIDATNMPGWYQFCPPNAALASGAKSCGFLLKGAANMAPLPIEVQLPGFDLTVATQNVTATTVSDKTGYSLTQAFPANFSSLSISAGGLVDILQTAADKVWSSTTRQLTALGASLVAEIWNALLSTITTASSIGKLLKDNITGVLMLASSYSAPPASSTIAGAVWDEALAGHTTAGSAGKTLSDAGAGGTPPTPADIADAVWDEALSGHTAPGSAGAELAAAGSAGDPWATTLPGSYGTGTAGKIIGTNLDATVSSRSQPGDIMKVSTGTGANQLSVTSGIIDSNLKQILGTTLTETAGQIAAAFKQLFNVASPTGTVNSLPSAAAGANGGLPTVDANNAVKLQTGTGTGQLDFASGVVKANLAQILGTALTETAGQLAAGFKKWFNVASPTSTMNEITLVDTTTTLTAAPLDSSGVTALLAKFAGITLVAQWLGIIAGKQTGNTTARTELRATGAGSGSYDETTDSLQAVRDRGDVAWITGTAPLDAAGTRAAIGMATANLDTQLAAKAQPGDAMGLVANALDATAVATSGAAKIAAAGGTPQTGDVYGLLTSAQAEPTSMPAANASPMQKWAMMFTALRNKRTTTATQDKILADDGSTTVATAPLSDDGTTFTRGEYV